MRLGTKHNSLCALSYNISLIRREPWLVSISWTWAPGKYKTLNEPVHQGESAHLVTNHIGHGLFNWDTSKIPARRGKTKNILNKYFTAGQEESRPRKQWPACQWFPRNTRLKALTQLHMGLSVSLCKTQKMHFPLRKLWHPGAWGQRLRKSYQLCSNSKHRYSDAIWKVTG